MIFARFPVGSISVVPTPALYNERKRFAINLDLPVSVTPKIWMCGNGSGIQTVRLKMLCPYVPSGIVFMSDLVKYKRKTKIKQERPQMRYRLVRSIPGSNGGFFCALYIKQQCPRSAVSYLVQLG